MPLPSRSAGSLCSGQAKYDLLLKNGYVIDPKNGVSERRDLAISGGLIAASEKSIDPSTAKRVVDVTGLYVTPGLVDIHVHVYAGTGMSRAYTGDLSVYPDGFSFRSCVTTMVDAGSSGWHNFEDFKQRVIDRAKTRVFAFVNIVGQGMGGGPVEQDVNDMNPQRTAEMVIEVSGCYCRHQDSPLRSPRLDRGRSSARGRTARQCTGNG